MGWSYRVRGVRVEARFAGWVDPDRWEVVALAVTEEWAEGIVKTLIEAEL